jgi:large exoprotein involved in heme utilization and adhesion
MQALLLLNSGKISTTAGQEETAGDGGNIKIGADFIFANQDNRLGASGNDIIANAFTGEGGNIDISADFLLGLEERPFGNANQLNDIDASSDFGPPGTISISANLVDPIEKVDLPLNPSVPKVARNCDRQLASAPSRFVDLGKGGLAKSPVAYAQVNDSWEDLRLASAETSIASAPKAAVPNAENPKAVLEAQGLIRSGGLILVAQVPKTQGTLQVAAPSCLNPNS